MGPDPDALTNGVSHETDGTYEVRRSITDSGKTDCRNPDFKKEIQHPAAGVSEHSVVSDETDFRSH